MLDGVVSVLKDQFEEDKKKNEICLWAENERIQQQPKTLTLQSLSRWLKELHSQGCCCTKSSLCGHFAFLPSSSLEKSPSSSSSSSTAAQKPKTTFLKRIANEHF